MSVIEPGTVQRYLYRSSGDLTDPGLPSGIWFSHLDVTGDASGGFVETQHDFQVTTPGPPVSQFFSLEQFSAVIDTEAANRTLLLTSLNFGTGNPNIQDIEFSYLISMPAITGTGEAAVEAHQAAAIKRIFMGRPDLRGASANITARMTNIGVGVTLHVTMMGFVWNPGAIMSREGIRRPLGGLW